MMILLLMIHFFKSEIERIENIIASRPQFIPTWEALGLPYPFPTRIREVNLLYVDEDKAELKIAIETYHTLLELQSMTK